MENANIILLESNTSRINSAIQNIEEKVLDFITLGDDSLANLSQEDINLEADIIYNIAEDCKNYIKNIALPAETYQSYLELLNKKVIEAEQNINTHYKEFLRRIK